MNILTTRPQWPTTGSCGDAHGRMKILTPRAFVVIDAGSVLIATEPKERHKSAKRKRIHTP